MSHLGESVYYYQDQGLALKFWSLCDDICRYGGPGGIGYFKRLKYPILSIPWGCTVLTFVSGS